MKKLNLWTGLAIGFTTMAAATTAFADMSVKNANVQDYFKTYNRQIPTTQTVCQQVQVPIGGGARTADTLFGALIGGALGNQVGGGSGKDAATVLGAIIGADVARNNANNGSGYTVQEQCRNVTSYSVQQETAYDYSIITFWHDGRQHRVRFQK